VSPENDEVSEVALPFGCDRGTNVAAVTTDWLHDWHAVQVAGHASTVDKVHEGIVQTPGGEVDKSDLDATSGAD